MINVYFLGFICSFVLVILQIPVIIKVANHFAWYDERDVYRKDHQKDISRLAGLAVFMGLMGSVLFCYNLEDITIFLLIPAFFVMFGMGLTDDLYGVSAMLKVIGQLVAALLVLSFGQFGSLHLYDFLAFYPAYSYLAFLIVVLLILIVSNSFNMIDGIDGLAGVIGLFVHLVLALLLWIAGAEDYSLFSTIMAGAIAGFLYYNVNPAKIFMGDGGAMLIGLSAAVLSLIYLNHGLIAPQNTGLLHAPAVITALLIIPVFDLFRVFIIRLFNGKSPFTGDRNHLHHQLKHLGLSDNETVLLLLAFNMMTFLFTLLLNHYGNFFLMLLQCGLCLALHLLLYFLKSFK